VLVASTVTAGAEQSDEDLRQQREQLRAEQAQLAGQIDVAQADAQELADALAAIEANVRAQEAQLEAAQAAVAQAEADVAAADAARVAKQAEIDELREDLAAIAVDAYVSPPSDSSLDVVLDGDLGSAPERQAFLDLRTSDTSDVLERLRAAQEDLEIAADDAAEARQRAEEGRVDVEARLVEVEAARQQQAAIAAEANLRVHNLLDEEAASEASESQITAELDERERAREAARQAELAALQRQIAQANANRGSSSGGGGGSTPISGGNVSLTRVGGITVNSSIAGQLQSMLNAAAADGIVLTGGGYRDSSSQIALRRAHCGTSHYAIYEMPASSCSPPTAQPGTSMHEQGLAIDFIANGRSITSRSSEGFQWLAANAGSYGFRNLPSEPWHWSVNGN
jgi:LAS superfamily LD-carboxypeptidase LdcB